MKILAPSLLLALLLLSTAPHAADKRIVLGSSQYPPFFGEHLPNYGVLTEITVAAFKREGYQVEVKFMPFARTLALGKAGTIDGIIAIWHTREREQWFVYSSPLLSSIVGFYKRKGAPINFTKLDDLKQYRIGTVNGYANPPGINADKLNLHEVVSDEINLRKLLLGRIDLVLIEKWVAQDLIRTKLPQESEKLEWMEPPLEYRSQHLVFSRKADDYLQKFRDFERGLKQLSKDGGLRVILERHGFKR